MTYGFSTTIADVGDVTTSPVTHILGDVVPLVLACGHAQYGNPSMMYRPGDRARCWHDDHTALAH